MSRVLQFNSDGKPLETHLKRASCKRWDSATKEEKQAAASHAVKAFWARLSPEQRSRVMKERAKSGRRQEDRLEKQTYTA